MISFNLLEDTRDTRLDASGGASSSSWMDTCLRTFDISAKSKEACEEEAEHLTLHFLFLARVFHQGSDGGSAKPGSTETRG